jgi:hypothetical protein
VEAHLFCGLDQLGVPALLESHREEHDVREVSQRPPGASRHRRRRDNHNVGRGAELFEDSHHVRALIPVDHLGRIVARAEDEQTWSDLVQYQRKLVTDVLRVLEQVG